MKPGTILKLCGMEMEFKYECGKDYVFEWYHEGKEYLFRTSKVEVERRLTLKKN
jgi:hypothetical protein